MMELCAVADAVANFTDILDYLALHDFLEILIIIILHLLQRRFKGCKICWERRRGEEIAALRERRRVPPEEVKAAFPCLTEGGRGM